MSENKVLARPYAKAAFELALETQDVSSWSHALHVAAMVIDEPSVKKQLVSPVLSQESFVTFILDILGDKVTFGIKNFLFLLAANKRLGVLSDIYHLFEAHRLAYEKSIHVEVSTAFPLAFEQQEALKKSLQKKLNYKIKLHNTIDTRLLGGIVVRWGDRVIDGSIRGKLNRLENCMQSKGEVWQ